MITGNIGNHRPIPGNCRGAVLVKPFDQAEIIAGQGTVGLEIAARAGYQPDASVSLWKKMTAASGGSGGPGFLSTHPSGPERIRQLEANVPKVTALYDAARKR